MNGFEKSKQKLLLLDTGVTKTTVRPGMSKKVMEVRLSRWKLISATRGSLKIHGEAEIKIQIGNTRIKH